MDLKGNANSPLTPFDPRTMIQSLDDQGRGLRVVFFRPQSAADRWGHVVATVLSAGKAEEMLVPRLVSQEGAGTDGWLLSPPLQSLAIEERPEGAVALLVGMSGRSHWSASFEVRPNRQLMVDIACRLGTGTDEWHLGSTYRQDLRAEPGSDRTELQLDSHREVRVDYGPEIELRDFPGGVHLAVVRTTERPIRWKYTLQYCG